MFRLIGVSSILTLTLTAAIVPSWWLPDSIANVSREIIDRIFDWQNETARIPEKISGQIANTSALDVAKTICSLPLDWLDHTFCVKCPTLESICPNENVTYWLYNKGLSKKPYQILADDPASIQYAPFIPNADLVILIHGYTGHRDYSPNTELRPAYLTRGKVNVISLDYSGAAIEGCYIHAAYNTEIVGRCAALLIHEIYEQRADIASPETTHVVGFSLGSHVAGAVGRYLSEAGHNLTRITGLDPAMPLFEPLLTSRRLKVGDALFVDVIHTNAGFKGKVLQVGDVDFYINNARVQPGCISNSSCDHVRAVEVFAESILSTDGFYGIPCTVNYLFSVIAGIAENACTIEQDLMGKKPVLMGEYVSHNFLVQGVLRNYFYIWSPYLHHYTNLDRIHRMARGTYLVITNDEPPYAKGEPTLKDIQTLRHYFLAL